MSNSFKNLGPAVKSETIKGNVTTSSTNIFLHFNSWLGSWFNQSKQIDTRTVKKTQQEAGAQHRSFSFEWKIENYKICRLKPCEKLLSPKFQVLHRQMELDWQLIVYPNGDSKINPNFLSVYLVLKQSKQQAQMACNFTISLNDVIEENFTKTLSDGMSEGNSRFISNSHPQIQTKDLNVKCVLDVFSSDLESSTSVNEEKSKSDLVALTILSGECSDTFTWNIYNFHKNVNPTTFKTDFYTLFEGTTLKWQLKLLYIGNRIDVNPALQLLSYHKINEIPLFTLTFTIIDSELTVIKSRSFEPQDFSMNSRIEPTGFVRREELFDAKNFSIICVLRCPINYVTAEGYPSTSRTTFDRNAIDRCNVGSSIAVASLSFKPVIHTVIWTIKNARKATSRDIESPDICLGLGQSKSQWRIVLRHSVDHIRTDIKVKQIMKIVTKVESSASFNPKMTFLIGIGDHVFDKLNEPSHSWLSPFYLSLNDPSIVNDDWTVCCKFNLMIDSVLPNDIAPIESEQRITTILN